MRCACGHTLFAARLRRGVVPNVPRWLVVGRGEKPTGLGAVPMGTAPVPDETLWGRVDVDLNVGTLETRCRSCARLRHERRVGGGTLIARWRLGQQIFLLMSDVVDAGCVTAQFRGHTSTRSVPVVVETEVPQEPVEVETEESTTTLPQGAVIGDIVYRVDAPLDLSGEFRLVLIDACLKVTTPVGVYQFGAA